MAIVLFGALAVLSLGLSLHFWRRSQRVAALLIEGSKSFDALRQKNARLEKALADLEQQMIEVRRHEDQNRRTLTSVSTQAAQRELEIENRYQDSLRKIRDVEQQRDYILQQHDRIQQQQLALQSQREEAVTAIVPLKTELQQLRTQLEATEREFQAWKSRPVIKPEEFEALRRRANNYERLYSGMKGLRDMQDERNKNWEDALVKMSRWILTASPLAKPNDPILQKTIGPIVGEAMQRIGATLLDIDQREEAEAERAALSHMNSDLDYRAGAASEPAASLSP